MIDSGGAQVITLFVILFFLATYRVSKLIAQDEFPPIWHARQWVENRWGSDSWQNYLATCMWCVSMYVSAGLVVVSFSFIELPLIYWPLLWLSSSAITGLLSLVASRLED